VRGLGKENVFDADGEERTQRLILVVRENFHLAGFGY
jgi:hypothetical protein